MRSSVSLILLLGGCSGAPDYPRGVATRPAVAPARAETAPPRQSAPLPPELAGVEGPSGTAGSGPAAYDAVGYASWYGEELSGNRTATGERFDPNAITAAHRTLPLGSVAEVTSLDTGRTILVRVNDRGPGRRDREIDLSRGAADQLGSKGAVVAVRVRGFVAAPDDIAALRSGRRAAPRLDAPSGLLVALRRELRGGSDVKPLPIPSPAPSPPTRPVRDDDRAQIRGREQARYVIQVAAFSSESRARALAKALDGHVEPAGALWRVRLGPYRDLKSAQRGRDGVARRGYGDAHVLVDP